MSVAGIFVLCVLTKLLGFLFGFGFGFFFQRSSLCKIVLPSFSLCYCVFFREGFFVIEGGYQVIHCSFRANSGLLGKKRGTDYNRFQYMLRPH